MKLQQKCKRIIYFESLFVDLWLFGMVSVYKRHLVYCIIIPVTRRVKGYTRFVGKYVTARRKRFRPHKVYIFLIRITSRSNSDG